VLAVQDGSTLVAIAWHAGAVISAPVRRPEQSPRPRAPYRPEAAGPVSGGWTRVIGHEDLLCGRHEHFGHVFPLTTASVSRRSEQRKVFYILHGPSAFEIGRFGLVAGNGVGSGVRDGSADRRGAGTTAPSTDLFKSPDLTRAPAATFNSCQSGYSRTPRPPLRRCRSRRSAAPWASTPPARRATRPG
jgi:hypothetical protein